MVKALTASISKWLVGSSKIKRWGLCQAAIAKPTLAFYPPDKNFYYYTYKLAAIPN